MNALPEHWIVVDLDGTICDCKHRLDYAKDGRWDEFHAACKDDVPFPKIVALVEILQQAGHSLLYLSGRDESQREATILWFERHAVPMPDVMFLRPSGDYRKDGILKTEILTAFFGTQEDAQRRIAFCLDDRDQSVEALRNYGLTVLQVREGDY